MKKINENQKVTLTLGQLKKLVKESTDPAEGFLKGCVAKLKDEGVNPKDWRILDDKFWNEMQEFLKNYGDGTDIKNFAMSVNRKWSEMADSNTDPMFMALGDSIRQALLKSGAVKMNENTKVTLTFGQLKRLVKESSGSTIADIIHELGGDDEYEVFNCMEQWLTEDGIYGSSDADPAYEPDSYSSIAFESVSDFLYKDEPVITLKYISPIFGSDDTDGKETVYFQLEQLEKTLGLKRNGWINPGDGKDLVTHDGRETGNVMHIVKIPLKIVDMDKFKEFLSKLCNNQ